MTRKTITAMFIDRGETRIVCLLAFLAAGGCASIHPPELPWEAGWRKGIVTEVGRAGELSRGATKDCRKLLPGELVAEARFVRATYRVSRMRLGIIALIDDHLAVTAGLPIFVNIKNCNLKAVLTRNHPPGAHK